MQHHSYQKRIYKRSWPSFLAGATALLLVMGLLLRPALIHSKQNHTAAAASALIAQTVRTELEQADGSFFAVERQDGKVTAITVQTEALNRVQLAVDTALRDALESGWEYTYREPLGAFLGSELFMTMGPQIPQELILLGTAETALGSDIESVGINQTRYRIQLSVICHLQTGLYPGAKQITVHGDYTIGEMMIFGELPEMISAVEGVSP